MAHPNAGKSSLLNYLLGSDRAIVTPHSGTTRDVIEESVILEGHEFVFCDSAGIRNAGDEVEQIGIELARERMGWADLIFLVVDASDQGEAWKEILSEMKERKTPIWLIVNKVDLNPNSIGVIYCDLDTCKENHYVSVKTGDGLKNLKDALTSHLTSTVGEISDSAHIVTSERHQICLERAKQALDQSLKAMSEKLPMEIVSGEIRIALSALEEIVGKTYTEDILGRIFSKFCIGK